MKNRNYIFYLLFSFLGIITHLGSIHAQTTICSKTDLPANLQNGLVAFYPFCGNVNDLSGNGRNGTLNGNVQLTADRNGKDNSAYVWSNSSLKLNSQDYIRIPNMDAALSKELTISFWIWRATTTSGVNARIIGRGEDGIHANANEKRFKMYVGNKMISSDAPMDTWIHVTYTSSIITGISRTYINGKLVDEKIDTPNPSGTFSWHGTSSTNWEIGRKSISSFDGFAGKLDEMLFYSRALNSCEVSQLYNLGTINPTIETFTYNSLADTTKACGNSVGLNAGSGYSSYKWSTGASTQSINATSLGWHKVKVTNSNGCEATDSTFVSLIDATIIQNDTVICSSTNVQLKVNVKSVSSNEVNKLPPSLQSSLFAYYPFNGNANDASGYGNHATVSNAKLTTDRNNKPDSAYLFTPSLKPYIRTSYLEKNIYDNFSFSAWVSPNATMVVHNEGTIFGDPLNFDQYVIHPIHGGHFGVQAEHAGAGLCVGTNGIIVVEHGDYYMRAAIVYTVPLTGWHHITVVYENQKPSLYLDGKLVRQGVSNGRIIHPSVGYDEGYKTAGFGAGVTGGSIAGYYFNGKIDDIAFWKKTLSTNEVNSLQVETNNQKILWSTGDTTETITVKPTKTTTYFVTVSNGISSCTDSVTITVDDISSYSALKDTVSACGTSVPLDAKSGYGTYSWSTGATTQTINATQSGWHKVTVKNASGCSATDSSYVSLFSANIFNKDTTVCKETSLQLYMDTVALKPLDSLIRPGDIWEYTLNAPTVNWKTEYGSWAKGNAPFGSETYAHDFKAVTNWPVNKTLYVRKSIDLTNFDLSSLKWFMGVDNGYTLYVNGIKVSEGFAEGYTNRWEYSGAIPQNVLVKGVNIIALELTDNGTYRAFDMLLSGKLFYSNTKYKWSTGDSTAKITVTPKQTTTYKVEVTDGITTCTDSVTISVDDISSYNALKDTVSACGTSVPLDAKSGYGTYTWSTGATTQTINATKSGWHKVSVRNANGCSATDSSYVSLINANILQKDTTICSLQDLKLSIDSTAFLTDTILVDQFTMTFMSAFSRTVKTTPGKKYYMKVSGTWDGFCDYSGGKHDVAWKFYPTLTKVDNQFTKWDNVQVRPTPDIYNQNHVYNYDLGITKNSTQTFVFTDNPYGDNCGSLKFSIYELSQGTKVKVKWSTGDSTFSISTKPTKTTTYKVEVTDGITTCTDSVTISVAPVDTALSVTGSTTFCSGDSVQLKAASNTKYQWYKNGVIIPGADADTYFAKTSGDYYARVTSVQTCVDSTRKITVVANPLPVGNLQLPSIPTICDTVPVLLNVTGGASYQWFLNGSKISNVTTSSHRAYVPGTYKVEMISDKGCTKMAADSVVLTKLLTPTLDITNDLRCINTPINFSNAGNVASSGSLTYAWNFGDGTTSDLQSAQKTYSRHGDFTISLSIKSQTCPSFDRSVSKNITIKEPTLGIRYADMNVVANTSVPLTTRQIGLTYSWQPVTGLNNPSIYNPILKTTTPQDYKIVIKDSAGCTTVDSLRVLIFVENNIIVPKAFSPNGDGSNDHLFPNLIGIKELKSFRVYNRWGILMYRSSIQMPGWDGNYQGKQQPMETYTWIADGTDINGKYIIRSGNTLLMR